MLSSPASQSAFSGCAYHQIREKQAKMFTEYLDAQNDTTAYVSNLNGSWGTGKTFFIERWQKWLRDKGYIAIKIDAWESDYLNDPLTIITAEVLEGLKEQSGLEDFSEKEREIISVGWKLAKNFLPVLTMAIGKHFLGEKYEELLKEVGIAVKDTINDDAPFDSKRLGDFGQEVFATHNKHKEFVVQFKTQLTDLIKEVCLNSQKKKVYLFIDELDRCRPTYAIEMLEVVKHLFDVPKLVFVMSTDTKQLESSIKAVYGDRFDSSEYLSRFFHRRLSLSQPNFMTFLTSLNIFSDINFDPIRHFPMIDNREIAYEILAVFCEANNISFRRAEQLTARIEAALLSLPKNISISFIELVGNIFSYELFPERTLNYAQLHTPTRGENDYKVLPVGNSNGKPANDVLSQYNVLWRDITLFFNNSNDRNKQKACTLRKVELDKKLIEFTKCPSFKTMITTHQSTVLPSAVSFDKLVEGIKGEEIKVLSGEQLSDYLHLFNNIS